MFGNDFNSLNVLLLQYSSGEEDETTVGENTLGEQSTLDGDGTYTSKEESRRENRDKKKKSKTDDDDGDSKIEADQDPFAMTYNYCEDLIHQITVACGLATPKKAKGKSSEKGEKDDDTNVEPDNGDEDMSIVDSIVDYATSSLFDAEPVSHCHIT